MRCSKTHTQITRRTFVAAAIPALTGTMAAAGLSGNFSDAVPIDAHPEWLVQWRQARANWWKASMADLSGDSDSSECKEAFDREILLRDRLAQTEARSQEGFKAQMQFLLEDYGDDLRHEYGETFLTSLRGGLAERDSQ